LICEELGKLNDATRAALQAADLYIKNREVDKALENWVRVTRFNSDHLTAHSRLAMTYERLGRKADAVSEYLAVASIVQHSGESIKAAQAVNYALQILPGNDEARQMLSMIKANQLLPKPGRPAESAAALAASRARKIEAEENSAQPTANLDPIAEARQKALIILAGFLFEQDDDVIEELTPRRDLSSITRGTSTSSPEIAERTRSLLHLTQAVDAQTQGNTSEAAKELLKAIETGLNLPAACFDLGLLLCHTAQWDKAIANLRISVKQADYTLASRLLMGNALRKSGRLAESAIEYLEALKAADSMTVPASQADEVRQLYEPLIDSQARQRDEKVMADLCDNIESQLVTPDWRQSLERARQQLAQQSEGNLPLAEILLQRHSSQVVESLISIRKMAQKNQPRSAMEEAFYALQFASTYLPLHIQIGELLMQDGHVHEAIEKFQIVAQAYNVRGETAQAVKLMRRIIQLNPRDLSVRSRLIEHLVAQGEIDEAIREYMDLADIYYRLAELDLARKTYLATLKIAQQSTTNRAWSVQILYRLADIDLQRLEWRQALRVFEQIRTLKPDDPKARVNLVDINMRMGQENTALNEVDSYLNYLDNTRQPGQGVEFLKGLVLDHPDKVELHKRLADVYNLAGLKAEAIVELDTIGDMLVSSGNRLGAIQVIQKIISLNPDNLVEYQRLLQQLQDKA
jgi:tetratricopeptide (TPR) repeat protein